ncbi:hypothetical protein D3C76_1571740 [compost metagenome]
MQGDHAFAAIQVTGAVCGHDILMLVDGWELMAIAQGLAGCDQRGIVFKAGQLLAGLQQAASEVAFA